MLILLMMIVKYAKVRISTSSVVGGGVGNNNNDNNTDILMTMQYPDLYAVPLVLMLVVKFCIHNFRACQ